jgi:hypothetical protein
MANANDRIIQLIQSGQITPQQAEQIFSNAGVTVAGGGGARTNLLNQNQQLNGTLNNYLDTLSGQNRAVMPVGVEPLHEWERAGLTTLANPGQLGGGGMVDAQKMLRDYLANPAAGSDKFIDPTARKYIDSAGGYFEEGRNAVNRAINPNSADIQGSMNPYIEQVTNRSTARLSEEAQKLRDTLLADEGNRSSASFGDLSYAQRMGDIDKELLSKTGDLTANLNYQGYSDAIQNLLKGGGQLGQFGQGVTNAAGTAQDIRNSGISNAMAPIEGLFNMGNKQTDMGFEAARNQIGAGQTVRNFNQGLADISTQDYMNEQNYPRENLNQTLNTLKGFQSGATPTQPALSTTQSGINLAGSLLGQYGGQLDGMFGGSGVNKVTSQGVLPWQRAGQQGAALPWRTQS